MDFDELKISKDPEVNDKNCNILVNSQPFYFAFKFPFGIQTLGVSGRYHIINQINSWKYVRIISSLANQNIYFSFRGILNFRNIKWVWDRKTGLYDQIKQQFDRFRII